MSATPTSPPGTVRLLGGIPIFSGLPPEGVARIADLLEPLSFPRGAVIIREGSRGDAMFIIERGAVKISRAQDVGEAVFLGALHAGSYFGEFSLFDDLPRSASVTAAEDVVVHRLDREALDGLFASDPLLANRICRNCLRETFLRLRRTNSEFTVSKHRLKQRSAELEAIGRDLSLARKLQSQFIGKEYLDNRSISRLGIRHSHVYHPCIDVGGDFINIVELEGDCIGVIIADVEGHGITASLATGVIKSAFSLMARDLGTRPAALMGFLNRHFSQVTNQLFATCYYALIDMGAGTATFCKAGHHHPLFWQGRPGAFAEISCQGTGLGVLPEAVYEAQTIPVAPGDRILFFTDGIVEQFNGDGEMYSRQRLTGRLEALIREGAPDAVQRLFRDVEAFAGEVAFQDDITLLMFEF